MQWFLTWSARNVPRGAEKWSCADTKKLFFGLHFLGRKMNICGHEDLFFFFGLRFFLGREMNICGHKDLVFSFLAGIFFPILNGGARIGW